MSTSSYLNNLLKSDLTEFAETSNLSDYAGLRKAELAEKLDDHLRRNATTYSKEPTLSDFYRRIGANARSPMKRIAEKVSDIVRSDDENTVTVPTTARKGRRKTRSPETESTDTDGPIASLVKTPVQTIARRASMLAGSVPLPTSPAVVTELIEQQTRKFQTSLTHAFERTHIQEYVESRRDVLSSTVTVNVLAIMIEAYGLQHEILPKKTIMEIGPIPFIKDTSTKIPATDLFLLLSSNFWAPFSLWVLTTLILPALTSWLINLPLSQLPAHSPARRAGIKSNPRIQFDPFVFNVAKGLIVYCVYALHYQIIELYQHATIATVNSSVPGGYQAMVVSSALGAAFSLYEAVLKR